VPFQTRTYPLFRDLSPVEIQPYGTGNPPCNKRPRIRSVLNFIKRNKSKLVLYKTNFALFLRITAVFHDLKN
jgi:hypothetical protein